MLLFASCAAELEVEPSQNFEREVSSLVAKGDPLSWLLVRLYAPKRLPDRRLEARLFQAANRLAMDAEILLALSRVREYLGVGPAVESAWAALRRFQPTHAALRERESAPAAAEVR